MNEPNGPYLIWCGSEPPPAGAKGDYKKVITLNTYPGEGNVNLRFDNISARLAQDLPDLAMDMLEVAAYVYCADQTVSRGGKALQGHGREWYRHIELRVPVRNPELWNAEPTRKKLSNTLHFLTDDYWDFEFRLQTKPTPQDAYIPFDQGAPWFQAEQVLMFSGGLDSLAGLVDEVVNQGKRIALVSHRPVGKISSRQKTLLESFAQSTGLGERALHVPVWLNKNSGLTIDSTQRARSFMYAMLGAVIALMQDLNSVRFYENGIVSINLPISDQFVGATASRSTHPKSLRGFSEFLTALLGRPFQVENPFQWKTKSEVVRVIQDAGLSEIVRLSNSCAHIRTTTLVNSHCGVCSQCIERRLAALHNGLGENDPSEMYKVSLFSDALEKPDDRVMVESYIRHAMELEDIDEFKFFERFPMVDRIITSTDLSPNEAAQNTLDLHSRHGRQVATVVESQIKTHAREISRGELKPFSLLSMVAGGGTTRKKRSRELPSRFPTPDGTRWKDILIELVTDIAVRITVRNTTKTYTASEMGFRDLRTADEPNRQWKLLVVLAENQGRLNWGEKKTAEMAQRRIQDLKAALSLFFGISEPAITNYTKKDGYRTRFQILDRRSYRQQIPRTRNFSDLVPDNFS